MPTPNHTTSPIYCIYRIVCFVTGKVYVGQTLNHDRRRKTHFRDLKRGLHDNPRLQSAYNKYGIEAFYFEVLEVDISPYKISQRERYWIDHYDSFVNGYNCSSGGEIGESGSIPCTWNGVSYDSIRAAALACDVDAKTMKHRLKRDWTCDSDVKTPGRAQKPVTWNGIEYPSLAAAGDATGLTRLTLIKRYQRGHVSDENLQGYKQPCIWNGIEYRTAVEAAQANGVNRATMYYRISKGWTCDEDAQAAIHHKRSKSKAMLDGSKK